MIATKLCLDNSVSPQIIQYNSNLQQNQNYLGSPPPQNSTLQSCTNEQPYFNGLNCISCSLPLYFNFDGKICTSCPSTDSFDITTKKCQNDPSKIYYNNSLAGVNNYIGQPPIPSDTPGKVVVPCPSDAPFSLANKCVSCPSPHFFNFQTKQC